ncbi:hypothetical protein Cmtc_08620 [Cupriavidus sp. TKC]|nr:hypothetical protein Cmtc_08620 [Cupriavidus sp. TKC]
MNSEHFAHAKANAEEALRLQRDRPREEKDATDRIQHMLAAFMDLVTGLDEEFAEIDRRLGQIEDALNI